MSFHSDMGVKPGIVGEREVKKERKDINELADELSVILASKMNRKAAAF